MASSSSNSGGTTAFCSETGFFTGLHDSLTGLLSTLDPLRDLEPPDPAVATLPGSELGRLFLLCTEELRDFLREECEELDRDLLPGDEERDLERLLDDDEDELRDGLFFLSVSESDESEERDL